MSTNNVVTLAEFKKNIDGIEEHFVLEGYENTLQLVDDGGYIKISVPLYKGDNVKSLFIRMIPSLEAQNYYLVKSIF